MSLRFLLDEDVSYRVAEGLRRIGVDCVSVHETGRANLGFSDEDQLTFAAASGRVLVTYNRADFQNIDANWRLDGRNHPGILWCHERMISRHDIGGLIRALASIAQGRESLEGLCLPLAADRR